MKFCYTLVLCLIGCSEKAVDPESVSLNIGSEEGCSGTAPEIVALYCENAGMELHSDSETERPTFTVSAEVYDSDGDFTSYTMSVEFDTSINGELDDDSVLFPAIQGTLSEGTCDLSEATVGTRIFLAGGAPDYETEYEWHVTVFDATGAQSATESIVCTTPTDDGTGVPNAHSSSLD